MRALSPKPARVRTTVQILRYTNLMIDVALALKLIRDTNYSPGGHILGLLLPFPSIGLD
jgi:hypothetical protein